MAKLIFDLLSRFSFFRGRFTLETVGQFLRYLIVGFSTFSIEYFLFVVFRRWLAIPELTVNIGVFALIFWLNFMFNRVFSFRSTSALWKQLIPYGFLFVFNLTVGNILLFSLTRQLLVIWTGEGSWYVMYLPKILIMTFIVSWNFVLYKKVVYK